MLQLQKINDSNEAAITTTKKSEKKNIFRHFEMTCRQNKTQIYKKKIAWKKEHKSASVRERSFCRLFSISFQLVQQEKK